jgi:hypothetical protein
MASIDQKIGSELPGDEVADTAALTAELPQLRLPSREIADSGIVRLGNGFITANFPFNSARKRRSTRS